MESFRFSHYPFSTRRAGKRSLASLQSPNKSLPEPKQDELAPPQRKRLRTQSPNPPSSLSRPKRDFAAAFSATPEQQQQQQQQQQQHQHSMRRCLRRTVSSSQSAGQGSSESPASRKTMNSLLGQLHAERKQRQQCPLSEGLYAMSLHGGRKNCVSLKTDSKLA